MKSKRAWMLFGILVLICLFFGIKNKNRVAVDPVQQIIDEMPQAPEEASRNERIKNAFDGFKKYASKNKSEGLCKGGFIDEQYKPLKDVAGEIISNRVLNYYPLEFATTQSDAGITCLSNDTTWVLFSALNTEDESEKPYLCTDSTGRSGNFEFDQTGLKCK